MPRRVINWRCAGIPLSEDLLELDILHRQLRAGATTKDMVRFRFHSSYAKLLRVSPSLLPFSAGAFLPPPAAAGSLTGKATARARGQIFRYRVDGGLQRGPAEHEPLEVAAELAIGAIEGLRRRELTAGFDEGALARACDGRSNVSSAAFPGEVASTHQPIVSRSAISSVVSIKGRSASHARRSASGSRFQRAVS